MASNSIRAHDQAFRRIVRRGFLVPIGLMAVTSFLLAILLAGGTALAEVRIGNNVFIGGHRVAPGSYRSVHIETTTRHPPWYGCRWFAPQIPGFPP